MVSNESLETIELRFYHIVSLVRKAKIKTTRQVISTENHFKFATPCQSLSSFPVWLLPARGYLDIPGEPRLRAIRTGIRVRGHRLREKPDRRGNREYRPTWEITPGTTTAQQGPSTSWWGIRLYCKAIRASFGEIRLRRTLRSRTRRP